MRSRLEIALLLLSFFLLDLRPARKKSKSDHAGCQPAHEEKERKNGKEEGEIWKLHAACILLFVFTTWLLSWWLIISLLLLLLFRLFHLSLLWVYPLSQRFARDYYFLFFVFFPFIWRITSRDEVPVSNDAFHFTRSITLCRIRNWAEPNSDGEKRNNNNK